jgi:hypothetical protein
MAYVLAYIIVQGAAHAVRRNLINLITMAGPAVEFNSRLAPAAVIFPLACEEIGKGLGCWSIRNGRLRGKP